MRTCPKCNGKYFDTDEYCSECKVELIDNTIYNEILSELNSMSYEEREKRKYEARYRIAYRYNYNYGNSQSSATTAQLKFDKQPQPNIPKCPTCGSTNIRRISTAEKATSTIMFGIFSNKRKYQFECQNPKCKYKW